MMKLCFCLFLYVDTATLALKTSHTNERLLCLSILHKFFLDFALIDSLMLWLSLNEMVLMQKASEI